jgi:hypothetical protein
MYRNGIGEGATISLAECVVPDTLSHYCPTIVLFSYLTKIPAICDSLFLNNMLQNMK